MLHLTHPLVKALTSVVKMIALLPLLALTAPHAVAQTLYGATLTNIVTINPANPSQVTVVGAHNLPAATTEIFLAYNRSDDNLYGIVQQPGSEALYRFNYQTGQSAFVTNLNISDNFESIEYVDSLGSLVVSHGGNPSTQLAKISNTGVLTPLVNTGRDNDVSAYDSTRNIFYTADAQGNNSIVSVNLSNGTSAFVGGVSATIGDMAFSSSADAIFALDTSNANFYRINTTAGGSPSTVTTVGTIPGNKVWGIAVVSPAPEPAAVALLGMAVLPIIGMNRRRVIR